MSNAVEVGGLYVGYDRYNYVLQDISFDVPRNTICVVVGPNGSGKSTLFRTIVGVLRPAKGYVRVLGMDPCLDDVKKLIGYLPEGSRVYPMLSVWENLEFFAKIYGVDLDRVNQVLEAMKLGSYRNKLAGSLSQGLRKRLALARAIMHSPEVLVLDEPFTELDIESLGIVRNIIREYIEVYGRTVILSTHRNEEIEMMSSLSPNMKLVILKNGKLISTYTYDELRSHTRNVEVIIRFPSEQTDKAVAVLEMENIDIVEKHPGFIIVRVDNLLNDVPRIIKMLNAMNINVYEVKPLRTALESMLELLLVEK
ncbi:MAG: ABC transporter ATP-binding protein [Ignisphaera sp.]